VYLKSLFIYPCLTKWIYNTVVSGGIMTENPVSKQNDPKIIIMPNGSYHVLGNVPLVHKTQVVSEFGEPLTWIKDKDYPAKPKEGKDFYTLCRCGHSKNKPYCDGAHREIGFDGTETADTRTTAERQFVDDSGTGLVVKLDGYLCMLSGYCGNRLTNIDKMVSGTTEPRVRAEIIGMIERCPSGAYVYAMTPDGPVIEPDLPVQIAVTTEITSDGPIDGSLWVTGNIPIERSDGESFETRNRVTLCNCGHSCQKPLCDGTHREMQQQTLRTK
jgi:CDGSH-type Zn-finger protein